MQIKSDTNNARLYLVCTYLTLIPTQSAGTAAKAGAFGLNHNLSTKLNRADVRVLEDGTLGSTSPTSPPMSSSPGALLISPVTP
ncbi:jg17732 [Pararge aegeria aegeria]|uniref:Jg17732 protein n=1 Tax=Pararge aegeria aegeria TaxID=348720 RepID=A0A8S4S7L7_9NEOP|nr:jg17732 [Pararge aegeria aegeria]